MRHITARVFLAMLIVGCSAEKLSFDTGGAFGGAELDLGGDQLRIDVYPSSATPELGPQTWVASKDVDWTALDVEVSPPVTVSGTVLGYRITPHGAEIPGIAGSPIDAQVTLIRPGTINAITVVTDADGRFEAEVAPARGYQLRIIPSEDPTIPIRIDTQQAFTDATELGEIDLGSGQPIFGNVRFTGGDPVAGIDVRIEDPSTGVLGPTASTDDNGHFLLRAETGTWNVLVGGNPGTTLPTRREEVTISAEDDGEITVDLGTISPVQLAGQVFDADGNNRQKDIKVRLTSADLTETDGDLVVETETDGDGLFNRAILPGNWTMEFVPPFDSDRSPLAQDVFIPTDSTTITLESVLLPDRVRLIEVVRDADGHPVPNAVVNAKEIGFDRYIYSVTADSEGEVRMELPAGPLSFMLIPPSGSSAVTHLEADASISRIDLRLVNGERVSGVVRTGNSPVPFAFVEIRDVSGELYGSTLTDGDGRFTVRVEHLP
jgi:hypothetical protein